MYELRDYQKEAANKAIRFFTKDSTSKNAVIVSPTGSGKSLIIAEIAHRLKGSILVFQPRKELVVQNYEKYIGYGNTASIFSSSLNKKEIGKVTFATIGSVKSIPHEFKHFDYCIIDECHLVPPQKASMYQEFLNKINAKVIGLTATPVRLKQYNYPERHSKLCMLDRMRPRAFSKYLHVTQIQHLVKKGFFAKTKYEQLDFDRTTLELNSTGGDYTEESMVLALKEQNVNDKVIETIQQLRKSDRKHIVVFTPTVNEAQYIAEKAGGEYIHAKTPKKDREAILKRFKNGDTYFVANVGILGIGFDFPELDTILIARPTKSLAIYYQWIGRGVRPHPSKDYCLIIDFVENIKRFGKVEDLEIRDGDYGWGVYSNDCLLTNRDIAYSPQQYKERDKESVKNGDEKFGFEKHKDKKVKDVPKDYLEWVWRNVESKSHSRHVIDYIKENQLFDNQYRLAEKKEEHAN